MTAPHSISSGSAKLFLDRSEVRALIVQQLPLTGDPVLKAVDALPIFNADDLRTPALPSGEVGPPLEPTKEMAIAGRKALAIVADRMEEAKLLATSSIDFWQRVGHEPANEIYKAMIEARPASSTAPQMASANNDVEPDELEALISDKSANRAADAILKEFVVARRASAAPQIAGDVREKIGRIIDPDAFDLLDRSHESDLTGSDREFIYEQNDARTTALAKADAIVAALSPQARAGDPTRIERTASGVIDWKMEVERLNKRIVELEARTGDAALISRLRAMPSSLNDACRTMEEAADVLCGGAAQPSGVSLPVPLVQALRDSLQRSDSFVWLDEIQMLDAALAASALPSTPRATPIMEPIDSVGLRGAKEQAIADHASMLPSTPQNIGAK
jgi:hypothetical protein